MGASSSSSIDIEAQVDDAQRKLDELLALARGTQQAVTHTSDHAGSGAASVATSACSNDEDDDADIQRLQDRLADLEAERDEYRSKYEEALKSQLDTALPSVQVRRIVVPPSAMGARQRGSKGGGVMHAKMKRLTKTGSVEMRSIERALQQQGMEFANLGPASGTNSPSRATKPRLATAAHQANVASANAATTDKLQTENQPVPSMEPARLWSSPNQADVPLGAGSSDTEPVAGMLGPKAEFRLLRANDEECVYESWVGGQLMSQKFGENMVRLVWMHKPRTVFIVKKPRDAQVLEAFLHVTHWLTTHGINVIVEPVVKSELEACVQHAQADSPTHAAADAGHADQGPPGSGSANPAESPEEKVSLPPSPTPNVQGQPRDRLDRALQGKIVGSAVAPTSSASAPLPRPPAPPALSAHKAAVVDLDLVRLATEEWMSSSHKPLEDVVERVHTWGDQRELDELCHTVDFIVCLGGDGTILWVNQLFKRSVPPVLSFALGSLGFLTPFDIKSYENVLAQTISGGFNITLRSRLQVSIVRQGAGGKGKKARDRIKPAETFVTLNEVIIDRGTFSALTNIDCYCNEVFVTKVQADGIIVATPTGSTAYSLSAGGAMVHPEVPAICFTPICPHSLSFRPLIFSDNCTLRLEISRDSRAQAYVTFDGRNPHTLNQGDALIITCSKYPLAAICKSTETRDWFDGVRGVLQWNVRAKQKSMRKNRRGAPRGTGSSSAGRASPIARGLVSKDKPMLGTGYDLVLAPAKQTSLAGRRSNMTRPGPMKRWAPVQRNTHSTVQAASSTSGVPPQSTRSAASKRGRRRGKHNKGKVRHKQRTSDNGKSDSIGANTAETPPSTDAAAPVARGTPYAYDHEHQ